MKFKKKNLLWWITFPFAHPTSGVYTTLWDTIFGPSYPPPSVWKHEMVHSKQQKRWTVVGFPLWILLYLIAFPLFFNPFRYRMEFEAFTKGSGYSEGMTKKILASYSYGWMPFWLNGWATWGIK